MVPNFRKIGKDVLKVVKRRKSGQEIVAFLLDWIPSLGMWGPNKRVKSPVGMEMIQRTPGVFQYHISRNHLNQRQLIIIFKNTAKWF